MTYYPQQAVLPVTVTVSDLIQLLCRFKPNELVVFESPKYGAFGSGTMYAIQGARLVTLEGREEHIPAGVWLDEETGEDVPYPEYTEVFHPWRGVVLTQEKITE